MTHRFQELLAEAGLDRWRFHDRRHACASLLRAQGVPLRVIQEQIGHSSTQFTANTYAHVAPELQRDAAERMAAFMLSNSR